MAHHATAPYVKNKAAIRTKTEHHATKNEYTHPTKTVQKGAENGAWILSKKTVAMSKNSELLSYSKIFKMFTNGIKDLGASKN